MGQPPPWPRRQASILPAAVTGGAGAASEALGRIGVAQAAQAEHRRTDRHHHQGREREQRPVRCHLVEGIAQRRQGGGIGEVLAHIGIDDLIHRHDSGPKADQRPQAEPERRHGVAGRVGEFPLDVALLGEHIHIGRQQPEGAAPGRALAEQTAGPPADVGPAMGRLRRSVRPRRRRARAWPGLAVVGLLLLTGVVLLFNHPHSGDPLKLRRELRKF